MEAAITDGEFARFQRWIYDAAGIHLPIAKKTLVESRLARRLKARSLASYGDYFKVLAAGADRLELQTAIDLITTNETYFFREPKHFEFLRRYIRTEDSPGRQWRIWSAASSSGEEAYSIAMTLADALNADRWEVMGSDISTRVLESARRGLYPIARMDDFPVEYLKRFCLKGSGPEDGKLLIDRKLRNRVHFTQVNLNQPLPQLGTFDVIFLRNVLIYFETETKRQVIARVCERLATDGYFIVSHSESLHGLAPHLRQQSPSIYRKA
jgi:chemotaxis protein methyltransferase CheR